MNGRMWTLAELTIINDRTLSHSEAAKKINRTHSSVFTKRRELGIARECKGGRSNRYQFTEEIDNLISTHRGNLAELARKLKLPYFAVWERRKLLNGQI